MKDRMPRTILMVLLLLALVAEAQAANLSFVSCWPKKQQSDPVSRLMKSHTVTSRSHWRAYATVDANANNGACQNTTRLYIASPGHNFAAVLTISPAGTQNGNGIRVVGWSPTGEQLLLETTSWAYNSDATPDVAVLIYDTRKGVQKPDVIKGLLEYFGSRCAFGYSVVGWQSERSIVLRVRPFREALDDDPSCVERPIVFDYELDHGTFRPAAF